MQIQYFNTPLFRKVTHFVCCIWET